MTDTGQVPGEGQPESAGMVEQPGVPAHGAYAYLSEAPAEDEDLLLPGAQGAWGNEVPPPAPEPVVEAVHEPGPHETAGRDSGSVDLSGVRLPDPGPASVPPSPILSAPHDPATAPQPPRRPLHLGPPIPDASASPVRSLADRGPAGAPVRQPGPAASGPEYLDAQSQAAPQGAAPWGAAQAVTQAPAAETVDPSGAAQAAVARLTSQASSPTDTGHVQVVHGHDGVQPVHAHDGVYTAPVTPDAGADAAPGDGGTVADAAPTAVPAADGAPGPAHGQDGADQVPPAPEASGADPAAPSVPAEPAPGQAVPTGALPSEATGTEGAADAGPAAGTPAEATAQAVAGDVPAQAVAGDAAQAVAGDVPAQAVAGGAAQAVPEVADQAVAGDASQAVAEVAGQPVAEVAGQAVVGDAAQAVAGDVSQAAGDAAQPTAPAQAAEGMQPGEMAQPVDVGQATTTAQAADAEQLPGTGDVAATDQVTAQPADVEVQPADPAQAGVAGDAAGAVQPADPAQVADVVQSADGAPTAEAPQVAAAAGDAVGAVQPADPAQVADAAQSVDGAPTAEAPQTVIAGDAVGAAQPADPAQPTGAEQAADEPQSAEAQQVATADPADSAQPHLPADAQASAEAQAPVSPQGAVESAEAVPPHGAGEAPEAIAGQNAAPVPDAATAQVAIDGADATPAQATEPAVAPHPTAAQAVQPTAPQPPQPAAPVAEAPHADGAQASESTVPAAAEAPQADPSQPTPGQTAVPVAAGQDAVAVTAAGQTAVPVPAAGQDAVAAPPVGDGVAEAVEVTEPVVLQGPQLAERVPHATDAPAAQAVPQPDTASHAVVPDAPAAQAVPQPDAASHAVVPNAPAAQAVPQPDTAPHAAVPDAPQPDAAVPDAPHPQGPAQNPEQPLPSGLPVGADPRPLGEFVPVEGQVPTAPHLAPTPPHPLVVPAPREGEPAGAPAPDVVQHADDLRTTAADQEEGTAAVAEGRQSTGPAAPGYADAEREAVLKVMRERRDIRNGFRSDPIPHEVLLRVLEAAHTAPSVGHSQPWDFVVIRSAETRRTMHELAMRQREAYAKSLPKGRAKQFKELKIEAILDTPVNIVVTADPTRGGRHTLGRHTQPQMAPYSSALAVENLWLAARAEGLGVGWVSFFDEREMVRALGLPEHLEVVAYLCVGYVDEFPDEPELMQAGWSKRRPLSWVVHEETYGRRALPGEEPHDLLAETVAQIRPLDAKALGEAWERQKRMTKPAGALGMLEIISAQLCGLSRQCPPPIPEPAAVAIFAGDHGVHAQGVTPWPQEVTAQMVANFLGGGAVCNAFASQVGAEVCVVDVGVAADLPATPGLLPRKIRGGTSDMTTGPAMTREEAKAAIEVGIETARDLVAAGNKALLTGEMGIANTTASAALISVFTGTDPAEVTGRGTGINDETLARKTEVVRRALELHQPDPADPIGVLAAIGGFEHAAMVGLLLGGASLRTPVILDGVSAGAAALVARAIAPEVLAACIAGHRSAEPGHVAALNKLGLRPLVDLDLRLGEGTGALLALPLVQSTARAMHEVATFDSAGVTEK
ncbi:nicotinate-nucleotide--dimethylbenzimidazole phosphoribosyltransferase [Streptomyces olivaceoviridis]|uniref:Nicotinate-nucleotide--dimethylbenzimidazole phosphoribosyltransferase n=1 Tax=Streptomyces olivaceoviridis TaxID=1921 RepID=A0ABW7VJ27_STROI|nr:nicotinate-nucleotide--dimethylbenzimidazole phosphoribosyltransferase [Streptomyces corchorusii]